MPKHVIIGLFEAIDTTRLTLAKLEVKLLLVKFYLTYNVILHMLKMNVPILTP
jgi:hypothetical protein